MNRISRLSHKLPAFGELLRERAAARTVRVLSDSAETERQARLEEGTLTKRPDKPPLSASSAEMTTFLRESAKCVLEEFAYLREEMLDIALSGDVKENDDVPPITELIIWKTGKSCRAKRHQ